MLAQSSSSQFSSAPVKVALPLTTSCALTWRDRKLFVRVASSEESLGLEALQDSDRLIECLKRSPVELVKLDSDLSPELLLRWAEACGQAKKACYVSSSSLPDFVIKTTSALASFQGLLRPKNLLMFTIALGPIGLLLATLVKVSNWKLEQQWAIGNHGRLIQILRLKDISEDGQHEQRSRLANFFNVQLPLLFKVSPLRNFDVVI